MQTPTSDHAAIQSLEKQRYDAVLNGDFDTFQKLCHPDLVYGHTAGNRDSLATYVAKLRSGELRYHWIEHEIENLVISGDTALVLGKMVAKVSVNETDKSLNNASLSVWTKVAGDWKFIAYHPTPLGPRPPQNRQVTI
ncbi:nuclear transport factor 2 family protein [Arthrobacter sp. NPDC056727]|uniref:nuclear transport factor 2 family protein n=1 Tax=Arthrobacter sp. NPDC056727 TaxID=3345927 RepID=UPI00366AD8FE